MMEEASANAIKRVRVCIFGVLWSPVTEFKREANMKRYLCDGLMTYLRQVDFLTVPQKRRNPQRVGAPTGLCSQFSRIREN